MAALAAKEHTEVYPIKSPRSFVRTFYQRDERWLWNNPTNKTKIPLFLTLLFGKVLYVFSHSDCGIWCIRSFWQKFAKMFRAGYICILVCQKDDKQRNYFTSKNDKVLVVADRFSDKGFKVVAKILCSIVKFI